MVTVVSKENLENEEVALGPKASCRTGRALDETSSCDCYLRIQELEALLTESRALHGDAEERIRADKERKAKILKEAKRQLVKTKAVMKQTRKHTAAPLKENNQ